MAEQGYDTVIVGAGSAGCVLAGRLSEDPDRRVLVLEAGGPDRNWLIRIPLGIGRVWLEPKLNWNYVSEPEPHADGRRIPHPRGKVIGGSSSINMMAYVRGHRHDYDRWRQRGNPGWGYAEVLPYFKRSEGFARGADAFHGADGPLKVSVGTPHDPVFEAFLQAGEQAGWPATEDYNGAAQDGFALMQFTMRDARRCSAANAFLHPAAGRPNLTVETGAHVTRVVVEGGRAVGVDYVKDGAAHRARAEGEVILAGGAINSPQLLLLSGIGPADELSAAGVAPVHDLPGVGKNLQDHPGVGIEFAAARPSRFQKELRLDRLAVSMLRAELFRSGFAARPPSAATAFLSSEPGLAMPDLQFFCRPGTLAVRDWFPLLKKPGPDGFTMRGCQLRPESRGAVTLGSADPLAPARIVNNFLATETDRKALRACLRIMRHLASRPAFAELNGGETMPGPEVRTDAEIDAYVRESLGTIFHPSCTCRMGTDEMAVVDPERLAVRGLERLHVVDASVMPDLVGGNINAPVIMIAEKAADTLRGRPAPAPAEGV